MHSEVLMYNHLSAKPPLQRRGVKCVAGLKSGSFETRSFCRKSRRKCVAGLKSGVLRRGVRFSAKEDLRRGVKICVAGLKFATQRFVN